MTTITSNRMNNRLNNLTALRDGWNRGTGFAPTASALHAARQKVSELGDAQYVIHPTLDGGLSFEPVRASDTYYAVLPTGAVHAA